MPEPAARWVHVHGVRQDVPPRLSRSATRSSSTATTRGRLELLHDNVPSSARSVNTVAPGTELTGVLRRKGDAP